MECPHIPTTDLGRFSERLYERVTAQRIPIAGSIELTSRCNLRCVHCYVGQPVADRRAMETELTRCEWYSILDQIVDEGCLWLLLTGGEPLIRPDFLDIYSYAREKGLLITLFTNATTITTYIADYLAEQRPLAIEVTLYGRTQQTYERITGVAGSHKRCMRGIELLMERNLPLKLKSVGLTLNRHELSDLQSYAEELGVKFNYDCEINMRLDGGQRPAVFRLPPEEIVALDLADEKRLAAWRDFYSRFSGPVEASETLYHCGAGGTSFHIDAQGRMGLCLMAREPGYDLRSGSFHEGWYDRIPLVLAQRWSQESACKHCEMRSMCSWCPGWAQVEHGEQELPVIYLCEITHLRMQTGVINGNEEV